MQIFRIIIVFLNLVTFYCYNFSCGNQYVQYFINPLLDVAASTPQIANNTLYLPTQRSDQNVVTYHLHLFNSTSGEYFKSLNLSKQMQEQNFDQGQQQQQQQQQLISVNDVPQQEQQQQLFVNRSFGKYKFNDVLYKQFRQKLFVNRSFEQYQQNDVGLKIKQQQQQQQQQYFPSSSQFKKQQEIDVNQNSILERSYQEDYVDLENILVLYFERLQGQRGDFLIGFDSVSEQILWKFEFQYSMWPPSETKDGIIYVLLYSLGQPEWLALNISNGQKIWSLSNNQSSPLCYYDQQQQQQHQNQQQYLQFYDKTCYGPENSLDLSGSWGYHKYPAFGEDSIFFNLKNSIIAKNYVLDYKNFDWLVNFGGDYSVEHHQPHVAHDIFYTVRRKVYCCERISYKWPPWNCSEPPYELIAMSAQNGSQIWSREFSSFYHKRFKNFNNSQWYEISNNIVFDVNFSTLFLAVEHTLENMASILSIHAIDTVTGDDKWIYPFESEKNEDLQNYQKLEEYEHSLLAVNQDQLIHVTIFTGVVHVLDINSGKKIWGVQLNTQISNILVDDNVLILSHKHNFRSDVSNQDNWVYGLNLTSEVSNSCGLANFSDFQQTNGIEDFFRYCEKQEDKSFRSIVAFALALAIFSINAIF